MNATPPPQLIADAKRIDAFLEKLFADTAMRDVHAGALRDAMRYAVLDGGKRLRGALVLGAARLAQEYHGGDDDVAALHVAASVECLHAYSLIHDDLPAMDDAATRRGKPACHVAFGEATAILAGDALQSMAFAILANPENNLDGTTRANLTYELARAAGLHGMAGGQALDLAAEKTDFDLAAIKTMQSMKTGALITAAIRMGGVLGGADKELLDALTAYGDAVGAAYQIADDLLDHHGDAGLAGKPTGRDAGQGKASLITHLGAEQAGAEAKHLIASARTSLTTTAPPSPGLDYMLAIAEFVITRDR